MKTCAAAFVALLALSTAALAADPVIEEQAPAPVDVFSFTGAYVGAIGGIIFSDVNYTVNEGGLADPSAVDFDGNSDTGGFIGAQVGYDYQVGNIVLGAVADIAYTGLETDTDVTINGPVVAAPPSTTLTSQLDYLGTVRARLGYALDQTLVYAHGGLAYGKIETSVSTGGNELDLEDETRTGYTLGAGIEHAFTNKLSLQLEYSFVDLGDFDLKTQDGDDAFVNEDVQFHTIKAGVNYRF